MLSPYKIKWKTLSSLELDVWTEISFDSSDGETETYLNREAIVSESHDGALKRTHGYRWSEGLGFSITFVKQNYEDFTKEENRKILKWLTGSKNADFIDVYQDDSEVVSWSGLGNFINVSQYKLANGRIVGYVGEFECLTPWALSPLKTVTKNVSNPTDNIITINIETDDPESAVYPRIIIKQDSYTNIIEIDHMMTDADNWVDGSVFHYDNNYYWVDSDGIKQTSTEDTSNLETTSVFIRNKHIKHWDDISVFDTLVKNNIKGETVVLDGANQVISSSRPNGRIFGDDFVGWNWIPLYDGQNELSFTGTCTVTIEWREPRKIGEF